MEFESIRSQLKVALGSLAVQIDHIGSTSVPGLGAKNIIDIQVTVKELTSEIKVKLAAAGYIDWGSSHGISGDHVPAGEDENPGLWKKFLFVQPEGQRRANIHIRRDGNPNQRYPILFRDYLRSHPQSAKSIEKIKRELVKRFADDVEAYYDIKDPVYDLVWDAAQEWARLTDWKPD